MWQPSSSAAFGASLGGGCGVGRGAAYAQGDVVLARFGRACRGCTRRPVAVQVTAGELGISDVGLDPAVRLQEGYTDVEIRSDRIDISIQAKRG